MSGTSDRARQIAALTDKLQPLGGKARGMPIEAAEWNTVVGVLSEVLAIDLAQETEGNVLADQKYAPVDHQHLGQVAATWLDADLQKRTADGGDGVATRQVLSEMQRRVASLQTQVAQLTALVQAQQSSTDRAASNDIDHTRQLHGFEQRVAGLEGLGIAVAQVAQSQQALQANVNTVLDLRKSLSDAAGHPIDVAGLSQQVTDLQALRNGLTGADGKPLRLRDLQLQVIDLSNRLPASAGGTLDERLAALTVDVQQRASADAKTQVDALRSELTAANTTLSAGLRTKLEGEIAAARDANAASVTSQIAAAESRLNANLSGAIAAARASLSGELQKGVADAVGKSVANLDNQIAAAVDARLPGLRAQLQSDVGAALTPVLQKQVADGLGAIVKRLSTVESGLSTLNAGLAAQIQAAVATSVTALQSRIDQQVAAQIQAAQTALAATVDARVSTAVSAGLAAVPAIATQAVNNGLRDLDARIAAAVATAAGGIPAQVGAAVDAKLAQVNVAGQIQAASSALATQLRNEIATSAAKVQANSTTALNASITALRSELNATINSRLPAPRTAVTTGAAVSPQP